MPSDLMPHSLPELCHDDIACPHLAPKADGTPQRCNVCGPYRSLSDVLKLPAYRDLPADFLSPKAEVLVLAEWRK